MSYYEIELGYLKDGADNIEYEAPFTICIATPHFPYDNECILDLCQKELNKDYDYVHSITHITEKEKDEYFNDRTYRVITETEVQEIRDKIEYLLSECVSGYYAKCIIQDLWNRETGASFVDDVIKEIKCSVSWDNYRSYDEEDIKMCIGRVILSRVEKHN